MRPAGEENEAGFEELLMRRICVGTGSPHKKYGKGLVCGESFKAAGISQAAGRNACHAAVSARRPKGQAGEAGAGARAGNDDAAEAAVDSASAEATRAPGLRSGGGARPRERAAASRGGRLAEGARRVLALPGGAAELGAAAGGGLARGDGARGRTQDGGAAGRRLRQASAPTGAADPREERQRHAG